MKFGSSAGYYLAYLTVEYFPVAVSDLIIVTYPEVHCPATKGATQSNIKHLVLIIPENHSFDSLFGSYCQADAYSNPTCTYGPNCCEAPPDFLLKTTGEKVFPNILTDD